MGGKLKVLNKTTGKLEEHDDTPEAERLVAESGGALSFPTPEELQRIERVAKHGTTAEQTLAAVETVGRTASFGAWKGAGTPEEIEGRRQTLREESPGVAFGAQAVGTVAPAIAGGALVSGAARAVGVGARIAGAAGVAAEGSAGGLADEVEEAAAQGRPVSAGRAMLTGIGGEVLGRALPAALRAGVNRLAPERTAARVVAGEAVADVSQAASKQARAKLAEDAYHMPPGRARDEALASTAAEQTARADAELAKHSARATEVLEELGRASGKDLERQVPQTTPGQVSWAADTAAQLRSMAESATGAEKAELLKSARALLDAEDSAGIWKATHEARERIKGTKPEPAAPPADDLESLLSKSVDNAKAAKAGEPAPYQRTPAGARVLEHPVQSGSAPDFSTWDVSDFAQGRGAGKAAGKTAPDYSGGARISTYQRKIVDGMKHDAGFRQTGRVADDAGKLGSEPTFVLEQDGTVRLAHGRLRMTAARELDRETVYGRVVRGKGAKAEVVYEGQIRIGGGKPAGATATPAAPAGSGALSAADELLAKGQRDPALFGKAAKAADDLHTSAQAGPGADSSLAPLEDQLAAAERWRVGSDKARAELKELTEKMRAAQSLRDDTQRAAASVGATPPEPKAGRGKKDLLGSLMREGAEAAVEHAIGGGVPFLGTGMKLLWSALGDSGQAKVSRTVRGLLSPLTSSGRALGASRAALGMTALQRFAGDAPDASSAFESRREMLAHVASNPKLASDVIASSLQGLAQEHPGNFMALSQRMTEALQYAAQNLPATVGVSLSYPTGIPLSDSELRDVADLWNSCMEPETVLDDIEHGSANTIQMQTLKDVHPDIYNDVRKEMFMQAADTFQSIPSQTKLSIDIMFGADGLGGLFASNEAARYITAARNMPAARKAPAQSQARVEQQNESVEAAGPAAVRTGVTNRGSI
jgi:hypothetical protein